MFVWFPLTAPPQKKTEERKQLLSKNSPSLQMSSPFQGVVFLLLIGLIEKKSIRKKHRLAFFLFLLLRSSDWSPEDSFFLLLRRFLVSSSLALSKPNKKNLSEKNEKERKVVDIFLSVLSLRLCCFCLNIKFYPFLICMYTLSHTHAYTCTHTNSHSNQLIHN